MGCDREVPHQVGPLAPYGLRGGQDGERGRAFVIRTDGRKEQLRSKDNRQLNAGDRVRIETPSGGGFGK